MMQPTTGNTSMQRVSRMITIFFFLSGMTGLIYEILWTRMTVAVIGGAPFAVSIILTVFMAGLGVGSYIASRKIDSIKEPMALIKLYGVLELIIGIYGLLLPFLLIAVQPLYAMMYNSLFDQFLLYNFLTFISCALLFGLPVICMGATLPILCRFYVTNLSHLGTHTGRLYGLNTIGAAVGAFVCGFWLINAFGVWGTLAFAVVINIALGVACIVIARKVSLSSQSLTEKDSTPLDPESRSGINKGVIFGALWVFAVSGFCAMAYEVIWTKLLALIVGPITYSFTIVLVTFITGLALGAMLFGWIVDRVKQPIWLLIATQTAAALLALGISHLLGNSQLFFAKLLYQFQDDFTMRILSKGIVLFCFMILPTLFLGATFPIVNKIYTRTLKKVGRSIGFAYSINTIGAVLGSFMAGFILIPMIGKEHGLSLVVALQLLTSLSIAFYLYFSMRESIGLFISALIPAALGLALVFHYPEWDHRLLSEGKYHRVNDLRESISSTGWLNTLLKGREILNEVEQGDLLFYGDGIGGFTTVLRYTYQMGDSYISMANSGKVDASTRGDMTTQTLLTHFPMIFHPNPKSVMVVGLASGITAGEALLYPIERLDVVEINKEVVAGSDFFRPWNNDVLDDPRTNLIIQDGRAHLGLTDQTYDVIISEPSNPWVAGLAALFTKEYFEFAKNKLNDGGIIAQFIHSYQMDWESFAMVGRTFAEVFPNSKLVSTSPALLGPDYLLIGLKDNSSGGNQFESQLDEKIALKNFEYAKQSTNMRLADPDIYYRLILADNLSSLFGDGPINTDSRPYLEFSAPKMIYNVDTMIQVNISKARPDIFSSVSGRETNNIDAQLDMADYALSVFSPFDEMVDLSRANWEQELRFHAMTEKYFANHSANFEVFKDSALVNRWKRVQIEAIKTGIDSFPNKALSYSYLADLYLNLGDVGKAIINYHKSLKIEPDVAVVHCNLGVALSRQNRTTMAMDEFAKAIKLKPSLTDAHKNIGYILTGRGMLEQALEHFQKASRGRENDPNSYYDLGLTLAQLGKLESAVEYFETAVEIWPEFIQAHHNLGIAKMKLKKPREAMTHFEAVLDLDSSNVQAQSGFEMAYKQIINENKTSDDPEK